MTILNAGLRAGQKLFKRSGSDALKASINGNEAVKKAMNELFSGAPTLKVGLYDAPAVASKSVETPIKELFSGVSMIKAGHAPVVALKPVETPLEPIAVKLLKSLKERFRIAKEFLKHGHNPSQMVSKSGVQNLMAQIKDAPTIKVGLYDAPAVASKSVKKPHEPIAVMLLKSLKERFRIAKEFLKHGHNPSQMVSKSEVQNLMAQIKDAPTLNIGLFDKKLNGAAFIGAQRNEDVQAAKKMLEIIQ